MQLGEIGNPDAILHGKPLDGVRILAAEQMQSLPFATQLLARLGADVIKVEHPVHGESGRGSTPAMADPEGRNVGATFLRNNFNNITVHILQISYNFRKQIASKMFRLSKILFVCLCFFNIHNII